MPSSSQLTFSWEPHTHTIWHLETGAGVRVYYDLALVPFVADASFLTYYCLMDSKHVAFQSTVPMQQDGFMFLAIKFYSRHRNLTVDEIFFSDPRTNK